MLGRTGSVGLLCRFSSTSPPPEISRLHYPASSGSRKEVRQLSPAQVNQKLKANEYSHTIPRGSASHGVLGFHSNMLPSNQPGEDRRSSATFLPGHGGLMFGVFDGHAGPFCAHAVSQRLFYYMAVAMLPLRTLSELERAVEEERPVPPLLEWHKHPQDHSDTDGGEASAYSLRNYWQERLEEEEEEEEEVRVWRRHPLCRPVSCVFVDLAFQSIIKEMHGWSSWGNNAKDDSRVSSALVSAFRRLDYDLSVEAQVYLSRRTDLHGEAVSQSSPLRVVLSGCTACVAYISGGTIRLANLGDSRAVLGVQDANGRWSALSLTNDHNAQNPDELQRILGEHPPSEQRTVIRHERLLGQLLPFRAFGDVRFKWSVEMLNRVYETRHDILSALGEALRTPPPHYLTPPYLSAQPEVTWHRITPADKFLVLATDGLWEVMHRQMVIQLVAQQLTGLQQQRPIIPGTGMTLGGLQHLLLERKGRALSELEDQNAATHLLRHALGDDGYGAVAPNRLAKMLSLPTDLARRYRDDITITVIYLNEPNM